MSYGNYDIETWDPDSLFLTGKALIDRQTGFLNKLARRYSDDAWNNEVRERRIKKEAEKRYDFVYRMSYNKAVGYISRRDKLQLLNGSSYNRQYNRKPELTDAEKYEKELLDAYYDYKNTPGYGLQKHDVKQEKKIDKIDLTKHSMSKRTKEKIRDKMLALYRACAGRKGYRAGNVNFTLLTLTFVAQVDDYTGMSVLNKFLTTLRKRYGTINYISVTERQQNGNIHFHILADMRFPIAYINSLWIKQQAEAGIRNYEGEHELMQDWGCSFSDLHNNGWHDVAQKYLNPVDVDKVKTIDGVSCYLTKYVTKNDGEFDCAVWSCSRSISRIFTNAIIDQETFYKTGDKKLNSITSRGGYYKDESGNQVYKPPKTFVNETYYGQYCTINSLYNKSRYKKYLDEMNDINKIILKLHLEDKVLPADAFPDVLSLKIIDFRKNYTEKLQLL